MFILLEFKKVGAIVTEEASFIAKPCIYKRRWSTLIIYWRLIHSSNMQRITTLMKIKCLTHTSSAQWANIFGVLTSASKIIFSIMAMILYLLHSFGNQFQDPSVNFSLLVTIVLGVGRSCLILMTLMVI